MCLKHTKYNSLHQIFVELYREFNVPVLENIDFKVIFKNTALF